MRFQNILLFVALASCSSVLSRSMIVMTNQVSTSHEDFAVQKNGYPVIPPGENCLQYANRMISARFVPKQRRTDKNCNSFVNQTLEAWDWAFKFSDVCGVNVNTVLSHWSFHTINGDWMKTKCIYTESHKPVKFNSKMPSMCEKQAKRLSHFDSCKESIEYKSCLDSFKFLDKITVRIGGKADINISKDQAAVSPVCLKKDKICHDKIKKAAEQSYSFCVK